MTNIEVKILDQILLVDLSAIRLWTARKKLKPEMLEGKIPPATLASLGSMRVIDPEELKPFERLKRRATALVESRGVKFLGGYAIPDSLIHEIVDELNTLKAEFYQAKADFISRYDSLVDAWVNQAWEKNEWREAIRSSVTPKAVVEHSLQFGFAACRVAPDKDDKLNNLLNGEVRGLADQLYADTAAEAEDLLSTGLAGRGHVDQRTLNTLRRMNAKLRGLMFLSSDVRALTEYITELLDTLPTAGVVNGSQYAQVVTLVSALSTEAGIKNLVVHLNASNGTTDTDEELQSVVTVSAPAQTMVTSEPDVEVEAEAALPAAEQPVEQVEEEVGVVDTPIEPETVPAPAPAPAGQVVEFPSIQDLIEREQRQQTARRRNAFYF